MHIQRMFYLPALSKRKVKRLMDGMLSHFHLYGLTVNFDYATSELSYEMATMGRTLYPDESSVAVPFKLGKGVTVDSIRCEEISCFVNGFYLAVTK
jgi:hypothetical protein